MVARKLLCIQAVDASLMTTVLKSLPTWDVLAVNLNDLAAARKALKDPRYLVGLLLFPEAKERDVLDLEALIESHQATRWVGVFPSEVNRQPLYRTLIVKHLFDFLTLPLDPVRLNHSLGHAYGFAELGEMSGVGVAAVMQRDEIELGIEAGGA